MWPGSVDFCRQPSRPRLNYSHLFRLHSEQKPAVIGKDLCFQTNGGLHLMLLLHEMVCAIQAQLRYSSKGLCNHFHRLESTGVCNLARGNRFVLYYTPCRHEWSESCVPSNLWRKGNPKKGTPQTNCTEPRNIPTDCSPGSIAQFRSLGLNQQLPPVGAWV